MNSPDFDAVLADDLLLDALGAGRDVPGNRPDVDGETDLVTALAQWRAELVAAVETGPVPGPPATVPGAARSRRTARRGIAAMVAVAGVLAGGGVAAAAVSGAHGPFGGLHRLIFGDPSASDGPGQLDGQADRAGRLLDQAAAAIARARARGSIDTAERDAVSDLLDGAARLLAADVDLPPGRATALARRLDGLRTELALLTGSRRPQPQRLTTPSVPPVPPVPSGPSAASAPVTRPAHQPAGRPNGGAAPTHRPAPSTVDVRSNPDGGAPGATARPGAPTAAATAPSSPTPSVPPAKPGAGTVGAGNVGGDGGSDGAGDGQDSGSNGGSGGGTVGGGSSTGNSDSGNSGGGSGSGSDDGSGGNSGTGDGDSGGNGG